MECGWHFDQNSNRPLRALAISQTNGMRDKRVRDGARVLETYLPGAQH
jgi:hypothetical protein